ncbi:hypothetical protein NB699_001594 [Xanthomonas sacchari]|nr:hypothetical protein [Xanthomonas sacchari]MCW0440364.1 hypothetical protein [Xanthomonas sacchari]
MGDFQNDGLGREVLRKQGRLAAQASALRH